MNLNIRLDDEIIFICCTFNFMYWDNPQIKDPNEIFILFIYLYTQHIWYYSKSMNSSVHEHVHRHQTTKFSAHNIKWFYNNPFVCSRKDACLVMTCVCVCLPCRRTDRRQIELRYGYKPQNFLNHNVVFCHLFPVRQCIGIYKKLQYGWFLRERKQSVTYVV